jgi:hypothetical protein
MEHSMSLKDILEKIVQEGDNVLLRENETNWEASALLRNLSASRLSRPAHIQPGLYIADIDEGGYLGRILYRLVQKA